MDAAAAAAAAVVARVAIAILSAAATALVTIVGACAVLFYLVAVATDVHNDGCIINIINECK